MPSVAIPKGPTPRALLALAISLVLWASAYAGIRAGLRGYSPAEVALLRYATASLVLAVYSAVTRMRLPQRRDLPGLALTGILGFTAYNLLLNYGELTVAAGAASLLVASMPIWSSLLARFLLGDRLRPLGWLGILVGFAGAAVIAAGESGGLHFNLHALLILAAAIVSSIYTIVQKRYLVRYGSLEFSAYTIWFGTLFMIPFAWRLPAALQHPPLAATLACVYMGIFPAAIAYVAYGYYLARATASRAVSYLYIVPVLAIVIAWLWLGELPRGLSLLGGAISLAGVAIVQLWGHGKRVVSS
ncbi:MAG TPA: EamA family transporter [Terriglobales bacterium]|jgi:drug/metabolite transporter (DMT)-like permease|nr:EamA family transporter [Terriglobales bacterium]